MITASKKRRDVMKMLKQRPSLELDSKNILAKKTPFTTSNVRMQLQA